MEDGSDPFDAAHDPHGIKLEDYKNQLEERRSAIAKLEEKKLPLFAFMIDKDFSQSKTALMREPTWSEVESSKECMKKELLETVQTFSSWW